METKNCWEYREYPEYIREYCPVFMGDVWESGAFSTEPCCFRQGDFLLTKHE